MAKSTFAGGECCCMCRVASCLCTNATQAQQCRKDKVYALSKHALWAKKCFAGECIDAVSGELTFFTLPNCFELFGFDLMVDDQWRVWLLEVKCPAFEPDCK